jgi:hypothetical protein
MPCGFPLQDFALQDARIIPKIRGQVKQEPFFGKSNADKAEGSGSLGQMFRVDSGIAFEKSET